MRCMIGGMVLAAVALVAAHPTTATAARAVGVEIAIDGHLAAGTIFTWNGESEAEIWQSLKQRPLRFEPGFTVPQSAEDQSKATLTGEIELKLKQAGEAGASATVKQLELENRDGNWYVTNAEVDRTMAAAGLQPRAAAAENSRSGMVFASPLLVFFLLAALLGIVFYMVLAFLMSRRKKPRPD